MLGKPAVQQLSRFSDEPKQHCSANKKRQPPARNLPICKARLTVAATKEKLALQEEALGVNNVETLTIASRPFLRRGRRSGKCSRWEILLKDFVSEFMLALTAQLTVFYEIRIALHVTPLD